MAARFYLPRQFTVDGNGDPRAGAFLYFYEAGTDTPKDTYSNAALSTPNTNPVEADADGAFGDIFMSAANYKVILKTSELATVWTADDYQPPVSISAATQNEVDARTSALVAVTPATLAEGVGLQGSSITSAASLNIPDVGDYFTVAGSTGPITSIESRTAGREITLKFDSTPTITHNATTLIMPGGQSLTVAAGDVLTFRSEGSGNWRCVSRNSAQSGAWELIATNTPSAAASSTFTGFDSTKYRNYKLVLEKVKPATDAQALYLRTSTDGGSNYDASGYQWTYILSGIPSASGGNATFAASSSANQIQIGGAVGNNTNEQFSGEIDIVNPSAAVFCEAFWRGYWRDASADQIFGHGFGCRFTAADVDAVQLLFASGNITSGTIRLYGQRL
jgi:hypothetical protein